MMQDVFSERPIRVTVIGGGTGSFMMLSALKQYDDIQIAAIVNMADDGGSTGVLRDELGALPPGDVRQCLVALSDSPKVRNLFSYRFEEGSFKGHSFGNLLITALEKIEGNFSSAVETASEILRVNGAVIPGTLDDVRLKMEWRKEALVLDGENVIGTHHFKHDPRLAELSLVPAARANERALTAIEQADIIIIAPGGLYTSLGPLLVVDGIGEALRTAKGVKMYVSNLVTKNGQTDGFTVSDHAAEIERFAGGSFLDYVLYNNAVPDSDLAEKYKDEGAFMVEFGTEVLNRSQYQTVGGAFLGEAAIWSTIDEHFTVSRSLIRHDSDAVIKEILRLYRESQQSTEV